MARPKIEVVIAGDAASLSRAFGKAGGSARTFGQQIDRVHGSVRSSFAGMAASAAKFAAVTAGFYGAGAAISGIAKATVGFDKSMRNVNSIAQLSEKKLASLEKQVLKLAGKTAQSPQTLAKGLYDLVSSGFNSSQSMKILAASAKAATAGLTTTEISTKAVAAVLNAYHRPASDAANVSDALFQTVNRGVISFEDLSQVIGEVLPTAASLSVSVNDVGAALSTMTKEGIQPPEAVTKLRGAMVAFIKPSEGMSKAIKAAGYESGAAVVKAKGFQGALEAVMKTTDGTQESVAKLFPDVRGMQGVFALTGKNVRSARDDLKSFKDVTGATDKALKQQKKSISYAWSEIKSKVEAASISVGSVFIPAVAKGLGGLERLGTKAGDAIKGAVNHFKDLKSAGKSPLAAIGTMVGEGIAKVDWKSVGDKMSAGLSSAFNATGKLPGLISTGITAAIAAVDTKAVGTKFAGVLAEALGALANPAFWIHHLGALFSVITFVIPLGKILKIPGFGFLFNYISKPIFSAVQAVGKGLLSIFGQVGARAFIGFINGLEKFAPRIATAMFRLVNNGVKPLGSLAGKVSALAGKAAAAIVGKIGGAAGAVGGAVGRIAGAIIKGIANITAPARARMGRVAQAIIAPIHNIGARFVQLGANLIEGLINGIKSKAASVANAAKDVAKGAVDGVKKFLKIGSPSKLFEQFGRWTMDGFVKGLVDSTGRVTAAANKSLLFPLDTAIAALNAKKDRLSKTWDAIDQRAQRSALVAAIRDAGKPGGGSGSSGGGGLSGSGGSSAGSGVKGGGKYLQGMGLQVGESKYFGGVTTNAHKHYANDHYSGNSIDVNAAGGGAGELTKLKKALTALREKFKGQIQQAMIEDAGSANQHLHVTFKSAGVASSAAKAVGSKVSAAVSKASAKATGKLTPNQIRGLAYAAGFRGHDLDVAVAVALAESGGKVKATNKNDDGSKDRGLFQINSVHGKASTYDPKKNAQAAFKLKKNRGGFQDWVTYNNGAYKKYMGNTGSGSGSSSGSSAAESKQIAANEQKIYDLRKKARDLPAGKKSTAERKDIQDQIAALLKRNKELKAGVKSSGNTADAVKQLKEFDVQAKRAAQAAKIDVQIKNLEQLKAFKDAIKGARDQVKDLAAQAAQAWRAIQEKGINSTYDSATRAAEVAHDAAIAAINGGADAQELARLTKQDADEEDAKTTAALDKDLAEAKASGDKVAIKDAEDAIAKYKRGKREQELADNVAKDTKKADDDLDAAKKSADDTRDAALAGLEQQTADYEAGLNAQFDILTSQLENRKVAYADWAKEVSGIVAGYGLTVSTDSGSEGALTAGPGGATPIAPPQFWVMGGQSGVGAYPGKDPSYNIGASSGIGNRTKRAVGGWVYPGASYDVGELGRERFTPDRPGKITAASMSKSGGGDVHIHGDMIVKRASDVDRVARKLAWALS